ncbi:hypothetical protein [Streptomyces tsukubensis]|uniref:Lipoprotein n=1 Tax=Streptomyces tsukubensis TaxID=83656 RepID=A0A1V4A869_9ACTN|nr:hypothetical protein [Streptomyces tsukubensis]OON78876.1 hypothetical protein B1H18_16110 [Streptomyces tsukubensis]QFR94356.1 hypothetical protein GBW32_16445 [Streptomyces tsukubensis]
MLVHQLRRTGAAVAAVTTVGLMATGCSGVGASADDGQPGDPSEAVHRAAAELVRAGGSRVRTSMQMASGGTRVTITGEGRYDFRRRQGRLKVRLPRDAKGADEHRPITELLTPGALYMKNRGAGVPADKWVRVETGSLSDGNLTTGGVTDPLLAAELLREARDVTYLGIRELDGDRVRYYRGTSDLARAARTASPENKLALAAAAKGFAETAVPFVAYLDDEGRLRKVRHRFSVRNGADAAGGKGADATGGKSADAAGGKGESAGAWHEVAVASTTLLYAFGAPVRVGLPEGGDIYAGRIAGQ